MLNIKILYADYIFDHALQHSAAAYPEKAVTCRQTTKANTRKCRYIPANSEAESSELFLNITDILRKRLFTFF